VVFCKGKRTRPQLPPEETVDALFGGRLRIIQSRKGYRFSLDAVALAHFLSVRQGGKVADLGAGSGVISLIVARLHPSSEVIGVELQEGMVERACRSVNLNRLGERVKIIRGDVRSIATVFSSESFDAVVCNPPYRRAASGRVNPDAEKRIARHEVQARLADFVCAGSYLLRRGGPMALIYPATRLVDLVQSLREHGMEPKRLRLIHSYEGVPATLVLAEGVKGGRAELKILPPLVVYAANKRYTREMQAMLGA